MLSRGVILHHLRGQLPNFDEMFMTFGQRGFSAISRDIVRFSDTRSRYPNRNETSTSNVLSRWCPTSSLSCIVGVSQVLSRFQSGNWRTFSSAKTPISSDSIVEALSKKQAKELMSKLTPEERDLFLIVLNEYKSEKEKAGYEGKYIVCLDKSIILK